MGVNFHSRTHQGLALQHFHNPRRAERLRFRRFVCSWRNAPLGVIGRSIAIVLSNGWFVHTLAIDPHKGHRPFRPVLRQRLPDLNFITLIHFDLFRSWFDRLTTNGINQCLTSAGRDRPPCLVHRNALGKPRSSGRACVLLRAIDGIWRRQG